MKDNQSAWETVNNELWQDLSDGFIGVLATHGDGTVSARTMSILVYKQCFYFQTDCTSGKMQQIEMNPEAAIAFENYQIQGKCRSIGHPMEPQNAEVFEAYKNKYPRATEKYSHLEQERLICFAPESIRRWQYKEGGAQIIIIDYKEKTRVIKELGY